MKPQKNEKKLVLKKETVAKLNNAKLEVIKGGINCTFIDTTCPMFNTCRICP